MSSSSSINTSLEDHLSQIDDSISLTQTPQEQQQQQQEIEIDISSPEPEDYPKPRWQLRKRAIPLFPPSKKGRQQKTPILSPLSSATPATSPSPAGTRPPTKFVAATGAGPSSVAGGGAGAGPSSVAGGGAGAGPSSAAGGGSSGAGGGDSNGAGGGGSSGAGSGSSGAGGGGSSGAGGGSSGAGGGSSGGGSSGAGGGSSGAGGGSSRAAGPIPPRGPRRQRGPRGRRNHPRSNHPYHQPTVNVSLPVYTPKQITHHSYINSLYTAWISHSHLSNIIIVPNCYTWTPTCFCKHEYFWHTFLTRHAANFGLVYTISLLHRSFRGSSTPIIVPRPYFSACATLAPPPQSCD